MNVELNLNDQVEVVLTADGARMLNEHYGKYDRFHDWRDVQEGKVYKTELWHLAKVFGDKLYNGATQMPFEKNTVRVIGGA